MKLEETLAISPGVTAIIGGGGKTTLLLALARELACRWRVIVCTTTHILPPAGIPLVTGGGEDVAAALGKGGLVCAAGWAGDGKLGPSAVPMRRLQALSAFVLVEADGSRGRPMKAHAAHEPVIPPQANQTILVVGASGFGRTIQDAAHRPELYAGKLGVPPDTRITPELAGRLVNLEALHTRVLINQAEGEAERSDARRFAGMLKTPAALAALQKGWCEPC